MGLKVKGVDAARLKLAFFSGKYPSATLRAAYEEALAIFASSQKIVPVDTGRLRASGAVFARRVTEDIFVSYGTTYAFEIHERTDLDAKRRERATQQRDSKGKFRKVKGAASGESKYLQKPFERAASGLLARMVRRVARIVETNSVTTTRTVRGTRRRR